MSEAVKTNFVRGAAILAAAGFISRFLGLFYRTVLSYSIGEEGLGLYQLAYPMYTFLLVFSLSGIPVALGKLVSEKLALGKGTDAYRIFQVAVRLSIVFGALSSLGLFLLAKPIVRVLHYDERVYYSILAIAPALFIVSVMAAYRGFFQGMQNMKPTAYSQVIEQVVRMATIGALAIILLPYGMEYAAAGATFSAVTGAIAGLVVMFIIYWRKKKEFAVQLHTGESSGESVWFILKRIIQYAFSGRSVSPC